ncbi:MAG TPA: DNA mismatch repair protein [Parasegetibacter sp.]
MAFITDKQTLDDLNIFGRHGKQSVFSLFNFTYTKGGADLLERMFRNPMNEASAINKRSRLIRFFQTARLSFPFKSEWFDAIEPYLENTDTRSRLSHADNNLERKFRNLIGSDTDYQLIAKGVFGVYSILYTFRQFVESMEKSSAGSSWDEEMVVIKTLLSEPDFHKLYQQKLPKKLSFEESAEYDKLFRFIHRNTITRLLSYIYSLDVYISVASVAERYGFVFPSALDANDHRVELVNVYHPHLEKPRANSIRIDPQGNVVFLTGANMAGKSTFMKSLGIALYLAHMGFPVPAERMEFSVRDGLLTTINLADNLNMGFSHFYAEVLRVKKIAREVNSGKNMFVIFDELFRGTNVKDACEATIAIVGAFAERTNSMFIISTHIMEAGEVLRDQFRNIQFLFLPTKMEGTKPLYTYQLEKGITSDRHGMIIIQNEKIIDILRNGKKKTITA